MFKSLRCLGFVSLYLVGACVVSEPDSVENSDQTKELPSSRTTSDQLAQPAADGTAVSEGCNDATRGDGKCADIQPRATLSQCLTACSLGGDSFIAFCNSLGVPQLRALCFAAIFMGEVACDGFCFNNFL